MTNSIYNGAAAVLVVFSVSDRNSFNNIRMWLKQINDHVASESIVIVLVGNKCDEPPTARKVSRIEAEGLAQEIGVKYFETSAFENIGITEVFENTAR